MRSRAVRLRTRTNPTDGRRAAAAAEPRQLLSAATVPRSRHVVSQRAPLDRDADTPTLR